MFSNMHQRIEGFYLNGLCHSKVGSGSAVIRVNECRACSRVTSGSCQYRTSSSINQWMLRLPMTCSDFTCSFNLYCIPFKNLYVTLILHRNAFPGSNFCRAAPAPSPTTPKPRSIVVPFLLKSSSQWVLRRVLHSSVCDATTLRRGSAARCNLSTWKTTARTAFPMYLEIVHRMCHEENR